MALLNQLVVRFLLPLSAIALASYWQTIDAGLLNVITAPLWLEFVVALLLVGCGGGDQVTVVLEQTAATQGSYGVGMTLHLYAIAEEVDAAGNASWVRADQPALTGVTDSDLTVVFDWARDRPFRIQAEWMPVGADCWTTADGNFPGGESSVAVELLMVCA